MGVYDLSGNPLYQLYGINGNTIHSAYDINGDLIFPDSITLKVMAYNVGGWYNGTGQSVPAAYDQLYYDLQNGILSRNNPDILCLEEYRDAFTTGGRTALSVLQQYYPYIEARQGTTSYWGHAICSKYPIASYTDYLYSNSSQRYYGKAVITANGITLNVLVTHLDTDATKRDAQSRELLAFAQTLTNVIACGDFNLHCHSKTDVFPVSGLVEWESYRPWVEAGYHMANNDDVFGFIDTMYNSQYEWWYGLDNIIVSPNITLLSVTTDRTKVTNPITSDPNWKIDHIPLIATMEVGG